VVVDHQIVGDQPPPGCWELACELDISAGRSVGRPADDVCSAEAWHHGSCALAPASRFEPAISRSIPLVAAVTVVGIPFAIGLLGLVLPGLFVVGYVVTGMSTTVVRERPYLAAVVGLTSGLVGWVPFVAG
jgi:hypothetical protein